jgi:hypothetical protein
MVANEVMENRSGVLRHAEPPHVILRERRDRGIAIAPQQFALIASGLESWVADRSSPRPRFAVVLVKYERHTDLSLVCLSRFTE